MTDMDCFVLLNLLAGLDWSYCFMGLSRIIWIGT